ncbi:MAG: DUF2255 family protein [Candidatus Limnocylindrales bacterium]
MAARQEVLIETTRPDGSARKTRIWIVVDGDDVFVRSVRGERGHWYQAAIDAPEAVAIHLDGRSIAARATLAPDERSVDRCSAALRSKYRPGESLDSMIRPNVLETTLLIKPR